MTKPDEEKESRDKESDKEPKLSKETLADLDPSVDAEAARWAVANCHLVRERFTVADLATFIGAWTPEDVDAVLEEAAALGAGL